MCGSMLDLPSQPSSEDMGSFQISPWLLDQSIHPTYPCWCQESVLQPARGDEEHDFHVIKTEFL